MVTKKPTTLSRLAAALAVAAVFTLPIPARAVLQETGNGLQNLLDFLSNNRSSLPQSVLNQVDQGASQALSTAAQLERVDIAGLVRDIETLQTSGQQILSSGGNVQALTSTLNSINEKLAPITNLVDSSGALGNFSQTLSSLGGSLPQGATSVLSQATQGVQSIQQAVTTLRSIGSGNLQQAVQSASNIANAVQGTSGFFGGVFQNPQISSTARTAISNVSQQLGGSLGSLLSAGSAVSAGTNLVSQAGGNALGIGGAVSRCINSSFFTNFLSTKISSGIDLFSGVPVVERGELLNIANRTAGFTQLVCDLVTETNARINDLHRKEFQLDPAEHQKAQQAALNTGAQTVRSAQTSYNGPGGVQDASLVPQNPSELKRNAAIEQVRNVLDAVQNSRLNNTEKGAIIRQIQRDYLTRRDPNIGLKNILDPTLNGLNSTIGTPTGRYSAIKGLLDERITAAGVDIDAQLARNQGFLDRRVCVEQLADGTCAYDGWRTVSPGSLAAHAVQESNTTALELTRNVTGYGQFENTGLDRALPNLPEQTKQFVVAGAGQTLASVANPTPTTVGQTSGGATASTQAGGGSSLSTILSNLQRIAQAACTFSPGLSICGAGGAAGANLPTISASDFPTVSLTDTVSQPPPPPAEPRLSASSTGATIDGRTVNVLVWEAADVNQCVAGNNWLSFGRGGSPTLAVEVAVPTGATLATSGAFDIYPPALFRVQSSVNEGVSNQNTLPPPSQVRSGVNRLVIATTSTPFPSTTFTQTTIFTPNVANLENDDIVAFGVNGRFIGAFGSSTPRAVSDTIRQGLTSTSTPAEHQAEYRLYQIGGTDSVSLTRGTEVSGHIRADASYTISCTGVNGQPLERTIRLNFEQ